MLRTTDDVLEGLRARKDALGLSNAAAEEWAGLTSGHFDKAYSGHFDKAYIAPLNAARATNRQAGLGKAA